MVNLDITGFIFEAARADMPLSKIPNLIADTIYRELIESDPELDGKSLTDAMIACVEKTGKEFVFIIDEWDALIREAKGDAALQKEYLNFLRGWFKNSSFTPKAVTAAYMTGILPIKRNGSQSAISDFIEYSVLDSDGFAEYTGFTENEVKRLCEGHGMSFEDARKWYDGYDFSEMGAIYNPYSVMLAMKKFGSYWRKTSAAESLMTCINMDFEGLQEIIARLIAGEEIEVRTEKFENDFETFKSKDDVLTLLIHLGYLTWYRKEGYSGEDGIVSIPNEEVRMEFENILDGTGAGLKWMELLSRSQKLLEDTLAGNGEAVAVAIEKIRDTQYAPIGVYNRISL